MVTRALGGWVFIAFTAVSGAATTLSNPVAGDNAPAVTIIRHIDMRAAALLTSGQRGGGIDGVFTVGVPRAADGAFRVPFWIELGRPATPATNSSEPWALEVFIYAFDDQLEVESFEGRALDFDLGTGERRESGVRLHGTVEGSAAVRTLRVLIRDRGSGEFYLDEGTVPLAPDDSGLANTFVVFPDASKGWHDIAPADWGFESSLGAGFEIGGEPCTPAGRPVVAAPSEVELFVVAAVPEGEMTAIDGGLWNALGMESGAGDFTVAGHLETTIDGLLARALTWSVPDLDPGPYVLELSMSVGSSEPLTTEISVIVVSPSTISGNPTWISVGGVRSRPVMPTTTVVEVPYFDALHLCAVGHWDACTSTVFQMEGRAIQEAGGAKPTSELFTLEGSAINALAEKTSGSIIPLLALHHDVFRAWVAVDEPVGVRHSVRLVAAMANDIRKRPAFAEAIPTTVAVLSSIGDTLHQLGLYDRAAAVFELALELDPSHQPSLIGIAADHEWIGHYEETAKVLRVLGESPDALFEGRLRLGVNLARIGRQKDAIRELRACTDRSAPSWVRAVAYEELAVHYLDNGDPEKAKELIDEAKEALPDDTTLRLLAAYAEESRGHLGEARRVLNQLDQRALSSYRESPRKRYARWPSEVFAEERRIIDELARKHLDELASAVSAIGAQSGTRGRR